MNDDGTHDGNTPQDIAALRDTGLNILMILVDQLYYSSADYGDAGFANDIKKILSFVGSLEGTAYTQHYPGFCKLREYAVVFTDHTIAESACIPSRASIMTGQCGPRTGVTQTDGLFKNGDASNFPWLRADGAPTAGDYFRELGYSTHYFGKWHVSDPLDHTLQGYGFGDMRTCTNLRPVRCCSQRMCARKTCRQSKHVKKGRGFAAPSFDSKCDAVCFVALIAPMLRGAHPRGRGCGRRGGKRCG